MILSGKMNEHAKKIQLQYVAIELFFDLNENPQLNFSIANENSLINTTTKPSTQLTGSQINTE